MKFNQWTVALAALGVVSLASAAKAEEKASSALGSLSSTTLSGYVDTSAQWNFGTGNANTPPVKFGGSGKADGFNLDVVQIRLEKVADESGWAAGYRVDLWAGPDANSLGTQSTLSTGSGDFAVRQAYVDLKTPIGNGLDLKVGVFDSIIGFESVESPNNPNYTRSYGNTIEPQTHTGVLATYRFCDAFSASAGVANTTSSAINSRGESGSSGVTSGPLAPLWGNQLALVDATDSNAKAESFKTYMGSITITAPQSMGFLAGSTLYAGIVSGFDNSTLGSGVGGTQQSYYVGATLATPVSGLRFGVAFDYFDPQRIHLTTSTLDTISANAHVWTLAGYTSYQATEKLSFHGRVEYVEAKLDGSVDATDISGEAKILATTATVQYDLWKNVLSRVELRWDHSCGGGNLFGGQTAGVPDAKNAWMLAANVIYKF